MRGLLLLVLLLMPTAAARAPDEDYRADTETLVAQMDANVLRARIATVEHAFGDRDARSTAHVMRVEAAKLGVVLAQVEGMQPPRGHARGHEILRQTAAWYLDALGHLESCYRHDDAVACNAAFVRIGFAQTYRALPTSVFS